MVVQICGAVDCARMDEGVVVSSAAIAARPALSPSRGPFRSPPFRAARHLIFSMGGMSFLFPYAANEGKKDHAFAGQESEFPRRSPMALRADHIIQTRYNWVKLVERSQSDQSRSPVAQFRT